MYKTTKHIMDFSLSLVGLFFLAPIFIVFAFMIKISSPGPIFFQQKRIGVNKSYFNLYKFRTMKINTPAETPTADLGNPDLYVTKIGSFMRKTSLDELPQLINVLQGDMSLVGPRPPLWNQTELIRIRDEYGVHNVRPGITGWTQVNGREIPDHQKAEMEKYYVDNMSLELDLKILWMTVSEIFATKSPIMNKKAFIKEDGNGNGNGKIS